MLQNLKVICSWSAVRSTSHSTSSRQGAARRHAATGRTIWVYNPKSYESGTTTMSVMWNQRGVAYWSESPADSDAGVNAARDSGGVADAPSGDGSPRPAAVPRVFGTGDGWLICVEAATGRPCDGFGAGGRVDLMDGLPHARRGERDYLNALLYG